MASVLVLAGLTGCGGSETGDTDGGYLTAGSLQATILKAYRADTPKITEPIQARCTGGGEDGFDCTVTGMRNPPGTDLTDDARDVTTYETTDTLMGRYGASDTPDPRLERLTLEIAYADTADGVRGYSYVCEAPDRASNDATATGLDRYTCRAINDDAE